MRRASTTLQGQPSSVPAARRWAVSTLQEWGLPETAWTAAQVVSELATNCTLHARTRYTVTLTVDDGCLRIDAADESPVALQARQYSSTSTTGRGLRMVDLLSTEWGVSPGDPGKTVWALLALEESDGDADSEGSTAGGSARTPGGTAGRATPPRRATVAVAREVA